MQGFGLIATLLIGALAGWIAERVMRADHGLFTNIVVGILGAFVGNAMFSIVFGAALGSFIGQLVTAAAGACLLIWAYRALRR